MNTSAQTLAQLVGGIVAGGIRVVDLTVPLEPSTPVINLPPPFANSKPFALQEISRYDERGPAWYWNNIECGEHTGTHFDAPIHWITGKEYANNATHNIPVDRFIGPACVIDVAARAKADPDFLLTREVVEEWEGKYGRIPAHAWVLVRTDWSHRKGAEAYLNAGADGFTPPDSIRSACPSWRRSVTFSALAWRRSVPTPARPIASIRCFRAIPSCTDPTSSGWPV